MKKDVTQSYSLTPNAKEKKKKKKKRIFSIKFSSWRVRQFQITFPSPFVFSSCSFFLHLSAARDDGTYKFLKFTLRVCLSSTDLYKWRLFGGNCCSISISSSSARHDYRAHQICKYTWLTISNQLLAATAPSRVVDWCTLAASILRLLFSFLHIFLNLNEQNHVPFLQIFFLCVYFFVFKFLNAAILKEFVTIYCWLNNQFFLMCK